MRVISRWATAVAVAMAAPADAAWLRVETNHFVVHVDTDEAKARLYTTRLESFDAALRRLYGVADDPARRSNRVQVFAFKPSLFVKVCNCSRLAGYYLPAAGESVIVSAYSGDVDKSAPVGAMTSQLVLLHKYSHHFMYSNFPIAYPLWFSEGFAEFNSNVSFGDDRSVTIGLPANYRVDSIHEDHIEMTARQFFNGETNWGNRDVIYGRGWLMTHYLTLSPERQGQLATYLGALNAGKPSWDAAVAGFGNPGKVYSEMLAYRRRPRLAAPLRVPAAGAAPSLTVTRLSEAEAAVLPLRARMAARLTPAMARSALAQARGLAGAYPRDAGVQLWLARAALAARNLDLAEAAATAAVEGQPASAEAMTVKGEVAVARAVAGKSTDAATWTAARSWLLKANHADPDAARPLILYYRSFLAAHASPSAGAIKGLSRALVLAPEDSGAHLLLARHLLDEPEAALARQLLQPIAFAPHARTGENRARQAIVAIDAGRTADAKMALDAAIGDAPT